MTKFLTLFTALFLFTASPVLAEHVEGIQHDVTVKVDGMVCDFCAQSLKKVFGKQDAVEAINVDLDKGEIIIDVKEGQTLDHDTITKLVVDSGYTVTGMTHAKAAAK
jgi:copper chaperone CopZ